MFPAKLTLRLTLLQEFYFKCANHPSMEDDSAAVLNLVRTNSLEVPCAACTDIALVPFNFSPPPIYLGQTVFGLYLYACVDAGACVHACMCV